MPTFGANTRYVVPAVWFRIVASTRDPPAWKIDPICPTMLDIGLRAVAKFDSSESATSHRTEMTIPPTWTALVENNAARPERPRRIIGDGLFNLGS
jgi:hypothetical protein